MEVKINREIMTFTELMFFGLSLRQFVFSCGAVIVAQVVMAQIGNVGGEVYWRWYGFDEWA